MPQEKYPQDFADRFTPDGFDFMESIGDGLRNPKLDRDIMNSEITHVPHGLDDLLELHWPALVGVVIAMVS